MSIVFSLVCLVMPIAIIWQKETMIQRSYIILKYSMVMPNIEELISLGLDPSVDFAPFGRLGRKMHALTQLLTDLSLRCLDFHLSSAVNFNLHLSSAVNFNSHLSYTELGVLPRLTAISALSSSDASSNLDVC